MLRTYVSFLLVFGLFSSYDGSKVEQIRLRGVQTSLLSMYIASKPFTCLDGSITIPFEFVNDDYCDCRDGSDEPGTSACPNGRFFCQNKGYVGTLIPSHFVGDGVCDCCDGSDEYLRNVGCNNTCFVLAQKSQAEREAKRNLHEAGVAKKNEIIAQANEMKLERKSQLEELEKSLLRLQNDLDEKEEAKKQAETPEKLAKDQHEKLWQKERSRRETEQRNRQLREIFADLDLNQDSLISIDELQKHSELDADQSNEFTGEEARSILSKDSVDLSEFNETVFDQISNSYKKLLHTSSTSANENQNQDETTSSISTSLEHEQQLHDNYAKPDYDEKTKEIIEEADQARLHYEEIQTKVRDVERQIDDLKKQSSIDFGSHSEYAAFIDQCYDFQEREYTYRVCMFKDAKQLSNGGSNEVIIGYWESWVGPSTNKYEVMRYSKGAACWNGPARSLVVKLQCGIEHRILDVREPSRCEYAMLFETPSACDEVVASNSSHPDHSEF